MFVFVHRILAPLYLNFSTKMASYLGPNVFVTGASRGIGFGLVQHLLGFPDVKQIFAAARTPSEATELQDLAKKNPNVHIVQFDSLDDNSINQAVKEVESKVGDQGLNLLINNAGVFLSDGNNSNNPDRDAVLKVFNTNVVGIQMSIPVNSAINQCFQKAVFRLSSRYSKRPLLPINRLKF